MRVKILIKFLFALNYVAISRATSCIECDSADDGEENCGYLSNDLTSLETNLRVMNCEGSLGCYTTIYYRSEDETDTPGWYTKRGCITSDMVSCTEGNCLQCTDNNCNYGVYPLDRNKCLKCSNADCTATKSSYCDVYLPGSDCTTFYNEDGSVLYRDCYQDLPLATRALCDDPNYIDCAKCSGQNCNTDSTRVGNKCFSCNGEDCVDPEKSSTSTIDCHSPCYIGLNDKGRSVRGCASDFKTDDCSTSPISTGYCFTCERDRCNGIIYPQTGRLQCHTCNGENCAATEENLEYCAQYGGNERCVTFFDQSEDVVISRGCLSNLEEIQQAECAANSTNCLKCNYNKCNKDDSKMKTNFCIGCNSIDNPDCQKEGAVFDKRCATNDCYSRLVSFSFGKYVDKGCLAELTACSSPDCTTCKGANCNNKLFPESRISCKSCVGEACNGQTVDKVCSNYIETEACVTIYGEESEVIYRNCYADAAEGTREVCDDPKNLLCSKCSGSLCNVDTRRRGNKCFKCSGIECFENSISNVVECLSECYVGMNEKGETVRDCADAIPASNSCGSADSSCLKCDSDLCNGITYPTANRLTCIKCLGDECEDLSETVSEYCETVSSTEACVSIFDSTNKLIERGCLSALANQLVCVETTANCLKCAFDNCNVQSSIDEKFSCISCSSKTDPLCVSNPQNTEIVGCTINQCFSKLVGQHIERGCGTALTECAAGNCTMCSGERCNSLAFPADRNSCYRCVGRNCQSGNIIKKPCTAYSYGDKSCITFYGDEAEVIYRDCLIDTPVETQAECNDPNNISCSKCTGLLCNTDTKRRGTKCMKCKGLDCFNLNYPASIVDCPTGGCYIGMTANGITVKDCAVNMGNTSMCSINNDLEGKPCIVCDQDNCNAIVYPMRGRLICKTCVGTDCMNNKLDEKYCERLHADERCVSIFDNSDNILERGCLTTTENTCINGSINCIKCNLNRCNIQPSRNITHNCVSCNSKTDPTCISNSTSPNIKICSTNQCYSRLITSDTDPLYYHVEKGCAANLTSTCSEVNCSQCTGDLCNNILYPSNRISCLNCRNDECKSSPLPTKYCSLYNRQHQACITLYDENNNVNYRGCHSDAALGTKEVCDDTSQLICTKCSTTNCNKDTARRGMKCFKCEGSECFIPSHPADLVDCLSSCYIGINSKGETVRGCASSFNTTMCGSDDDGINKCIVCKDDLCNGIQFPMSNRLKCHTCNDVTDCLATDENLSYCEIYGELERCVTVFNGANRAIERSCASEIVNKRYCELNYKNCIHCAGTGCNSITTKVTKLCAFCNSAENPNCVRDPAVVPVKYCERGCFTRLIEGDVFRGCLEDLGTVNCDEANMCTGCDIDKCNVAAYPADRKSCLTCSSAPDCVNPSSHVCVKYAVTDKCVTVFDGFNIGRKGCLVDQTSAIQAQCLTNNVTCVTCSANNCNAATIRDDERCISCDSRKNENCAQRPNLLSATKCLVSSDGECFTRISSQNTVRGCKGLLTPAEISSCRNSSQCVIAPGQELNNKIFPESRLKCYHCDSQTNANCSSPQSDTSLILPCKKYNEPENCVKITYSSGRVVRGCMADFSADICSSEQCETCPSNGISDGCNKSFAVKISMNFSLLLILSAAILLYSKND